MILDVLTRDYGVVPVLAKAVRKRKSRLSAVLLSFSSIKVSYLNRTELKILTGAELTESIELKGISLYCGFYINELIGRFVFKQDPCPEIYHLYQKCIDQLKKPDQIEQSLRFFELKLLEYVGYGLIMDHDAENDRPVEAGDYYRYVEGQGMVACSDGDIRGTTLLALHHGQDLDRKSLIEAKRLTRKVLDYHLQGRALKSRAVISRMVSYLQ